MFTGLIEEVGSILRINASGEGAGLVIGAEKVPAGLQVGDSVAVSGPCLTVTAVEKNAFTAWVMPETLKRTNLSTLAVGQMVNLEQALALGDRLGGHMVSGHIDDVIILAGRRNQGGAYLLTFDLPSELQRYIIPKGSVALDGISLTVVEVNKNRFTVGMIPHTASFTTMGQKEIGSKINLEVDMIGKYVEKLLTPRLEGRDDPEEKITMSFLQEKGYF